MGSRHSRLVIVPGGDSRESSQSLLNKLGLEFLHYRGWGREGKVLGRDSEQNFTDDHHLYKNKTNGQQLPVASGVRHPQRVAFGLPHNYGKEAYKQVNALPPLDRRQKPLFASDRRSSPLFFHIHQVGETAPVHACVFSLPAKFLPESENGPPRLQAFSSDVALDQSDAFWNPIDGFLDRLSGRRNADNPKSGTASSTGIRGQELDIPTVEVPQ